MTPESPSSVSPSTFDLRRRTPGSFVLVPSPRLGRSLRCQGQLEAAAAVVLSACPLVTSIQEQPLRIWYAWRETAGNVQILLLEETPVRRRAKGVRFSYIVPDFLVGMRDGGQRLIEVKPSRKLDRPEVRRKLAAARAFAGMRGWSFHVVTERELFRGPLLPNLRLLGRYRATRHERELLDRLAETVVDRPHRAGDLCGQAAETSTIRAALFHLLAVGRLDCDPRMAPLNGDTLVFPGGTIVWDPFVSAWAQSGGLTDATFESSDSRPPIDSWPST